VGTKLSGSLPLQRLFLPYSAKTSLATHGHIYFQSEGNHEYKQHYTACPRILKTGLTCVFGVPRVPYLYVR
jgi:hypothetical protein